MKMMHTLSNKSFRQRTTQFRPDLSLALDRAAEFGCRQFSRSHPESRGNIASDNLRHRAQHGAFFRPGLQSRQCFARGHFRRRDNRRTRPGQKPNRNSQRNQQDDATNQDPLAVLFPERRRDLGARGVKRRDFLGLRRIRCGPHRGWS